MRDEAPIAQHQVLVPGGSYTIGCKASLPCAAVNPLRIVDTRGFWIDAYKVVIAEYEACVETELCPTRYIPAIVSNANETVTVEVEGAAAFCAWRNGRLPTSDEWEIAARGTDQRLYPWGNSFDPARISQLRRFHAGGCETLLYAVRSRDPASRSPFGVSEMVDRDEFTLGRRGVELRGRRGPDHGARPQDYWAVGA